MSELRGVLQLPEPHARYATGEREKERERKRERDRETERERERERELRPDRGWEGEEERREGTRGQGMEGKRETNEVKRVSEKERQRGVGGRERPTSIFSTAISPWQLVDRAVWMKMGIQIKILFRLGFRKGLGIKRVEYLSKDTEER